MSKIDRLNVFINGVQTGHIDRESSGAISFSYELTWLEKQEAFPLSRQFPLREWPYTGKSVRNYFENLLPDDRQIRERVAAHMGAKGLASFDLLSAVGRDCVGALQFYPEGEQPGPVKEAKGHALSQQEVADLLRNLRVNPLGMANGSDFRISLAGAQSKTALLKIGNQWLLPEGPTPTTHILKPSIGQIPEGPDFSLSVENEWLCLQLLRAFDLNVAQSEMAEFDGIKVLVVERFDRAWSGKKLYRRPQEDFCQALGVGPEMKYEVDGGPGIGDLLHLLNESDRRGYDRKQFMKSQLLFWLLAAIDGHAKNFSLFIQPRGFRLTPFYDVISADPHINPKSLPSQKLKLAMAVGENRHYKVKEILSKHWRQTAAQYKFNKMDELIEEVSKQVSSAIASVSAELPPSFPVQVSEPIFEAMTKRSEKLSQAL